MCDVVGLRRAHDDENDDPGAHLMVEGDSGW